MLRYLSKLPYGIIILWCYLIWYIYFAVMYFESNLELWGRSLGIAFLVGFVLNINAFGSIKGIMKTTSKWQILRFFAIPFCVSSFPVLIEDKGFLLFFSPKTIDNFIALSLVMLFLSLTWMSKLVRHQKDHKINKKEVIP